MNTTIPYRRINLFAGPGAGKSTTAFWLLWKMKSLGINAEYCREWIKRWAYARRDMDRLLDQVVVMGRQIEEECEALATGCIVVSDSPILLQAAYAEHDEDVKRAIGIAQGMEQRFPSLNLFIERGSRNFNEVGRWENAGVAGAKDAEILFLLSDAGLPYTTVRHDDYDSLWRIVTSGT